MKFFCINLKAQIERRNHIQAQFEKAGIEVDFVCGFPAGLSELSYLLSRLNKGMLGCYISHERLMEEISRKDYGICCIFEDDIELSTDFNMKLNDAIKNLPAKWDIAFIGWTGWGSVTTEKASPADNNDNCWLKYIRGHVSGLYGYMVNGHEAAEKIMSIMHPIRGQADVQIAEALKKGELSGLFLESAIVLHPNLFKTTVQRR